MSLAWTSHVLRNQYTRLPYPTHSFSGQTIIVTGANTGLGFEAAAHYVRLGAAKVILAVRSLEKGNDAAQQIIKDRQTTGATTVVDDDVLEVWQLDMSSYQSIKEFAKKAEENLERIDILLENAGVVLADWQTAEGSEMTMTVNVYGTFLLALLMVPVLRRSGRKHNNVPTLTVVTSDTHHMTEFKEAETHEDIVAALDDRRNFVPGEPRYALSKLMEIYFIREFSLRHEAKDLGVTMNMINPGLCWSSLDRNSGWLYRIQIMFMRYLVARTTEVGSRTLVFATTGGPESHGMHSADCEFNNKAVSRAVRSEQGKKVQEKVYQQVSGKLQSIQPDLFGGIPGGL